MNRTEECIYYNQLFDLYGNLLTNREKEIFNLFYEEDLSLQEIADLRNVSKSSIGKSIKIITEKLEEYEQKLGFLNKQNQIKKELNCLNDELIKEKIMKILEI